MNELALDSAVASLLGALIGAFAGFGGALLTNWLQSRAEHRRWLRTKRQEAYSNSIRYLLRAKSTRSGITVTGKTFVSLEDLKEWFDELSEVKQWIMVLEIYCSKPYRDQIRKASEPLFSVIDHLLENRTFGDENTVMLPAEKVPLPETIDNVLQVVESSARSDLRKR